MCESFTQLDHQFDQSIEFWNLPPSALKIFLLLKNRCGHNNRPAWISVDDEKFLGIKPAQQRAALQRLLKDGFIKKSKAAVRGHQYANYVIDMTFKSQQSQIDIWKKSNADSSNADSSNADSSNADSSNAELAPGHTLNLRESYAEKTPISQECIPNNVSQEEITSPKNTNEPLKGSRASDETELCKSSTNTDSKSSRASEPFLNPDTGLWEGDDFNSSYTTMSSSASSAPDINLPMVKEFIEAVKSTSSDEIETIQQLTDAQVARKVCQEQIKLLQDHNKDNCHQSYIKTLSGIDYQLMISITCAPAELKVKTQQFTDVSTRLVACGRGCGKSIRLAYDTSKGKNVTVEASELKVHRCQLADQRAVSAAYEEVLSIPEQNRPSAWVSLQNKSPSDRTPSEERQLLGLNALFGKPAGEDDLDKDPPGMVYRGYRSSLEHTEEAA
jgi:hypothetical protein